MLRVGLRWDLLEWRDQLDVIESILADSEGSIDRTLDSIDDQIAVMFPEEETWGSSPGALRAQQAAEQQFAQVPHVGAKKSSVDGESAGTPIPRVRAEPSTPRRIVRSGHPYERALFVSIRQALMAIPRPPPPPTIVPE